MWGHSNSSSFLVARRLFSEQLNLVQKLVSPSVSYNSDVTLTKHRLYCQYCMENTPSPIYTVGCLDTAFDLSALLLVVDTSGPDPSTLLLVPIAALQSGHTDTLFVYTNVQGEFGHFFLLGICKYITVITIIFHRKYLAFRF
jgi:hypothetical protein